MTISVIAIDPSSKAPNVDSGAFRLFCIVRLPSRVDDGPWNRGGDRAQRRSDFPACSAVPTMWFRIQGKLNECLRNLVNDGRRGKRYSSGFASVAAIAKLCTCRLLASCNLSFRPCGGISFVRSCGKPGTIAGAPLVFILILTTSTVIPSARTVIPTLWRNLFRSSIAAPSLGPAETERGEIPRLRSG